MPEKITLRQAKPSEEDFQTILRFFQGLESVIEERTNPDTGEEVRTSEEIGLWLERDWHKVYLCWERVFWAGKCAIENTCDPNLDYLALKPSLEAAMHAVNVLDDLLTDAGEGTARGRAIDLLPRHQVERAREAINAAWPGNATGFLA